jgi:hypothetical protein
MRLMKRSGGGRSKASEAGARLVGSIRNGLPPGVELDEREEALLDLAARQANDVASLEADIAERGVRVQERRHESKLLHGSSRSLIAGTQVEAVDIEFVAAFLPGQVIGTHGFELGPETIEVISTVVRFVLATRCGAARRSNAQEVLLYAPSLAWKVAPQPSPITQLESDPKPSPQLG